MSPACLAWSLVPAMSSGQFIGVVVALMALGFLLLGAELFVIPGFGIAGVLGALCLGSGVVLSWSAFGASWGVALLCGSLGVAFLAVLVFFKSGAGKRMQLESSLAGASAVSEDEERHLGRRGVAFTMLRPSGIGEFGDERMQVETDGDFLAKGTPLVVVAVEMGRVVVEEAPPDTGNG